MSILAFCVRKNCYLSTGGVWGFDPNYLKQTREVHATAVLLWWRSKDSGVPSLCFCCRQGLCTQPATCRTGRKPPWCIMLLLFFLLFFCCSLPPSNHNRLSWSATWVMTTPGTLSPRCHFCHWISCWLQPCIPRLLFSAHVLTLSCLASRASKEKRK